MRNSRMHIFKTNVTCELLALKKSALKGRTDNILFIRSPLIVRLQAMPARSGWHLPFARGCRDFTDPMYLHHSE